MKVKFNFLIRPVINILLALTAIYPAIKVGLWTPYVWQAKQVGITDVAGTGLIIVASVEIAYTYAKLRFGRKK